MEKFPVSVCIPYHRRLGSFDSLKRVLTMLGETSHLPEDSYDGFVTSKTSKLVEEILIVGDNAVRPGTNNCCLQINIGLKHATQPYFFLVHQDVLAFNLEEMLDSLRADLPDVILYANVFKERHINDPNPLYWVGPKRQNEAWFYIGAETELLRNLGGMDEEFWEFWGWEDVLMLDWWKKRAKVIFTEDVYGIHLWHPEHPAETIGGMNGALCKQKMEDPDYFPNKGKEWGVIHND